MTKTTTLLLIDVQIDFHPPAGSLAIPNADADAERIAAFIRNHCPDRVVATLDSHDALHIAHPDFWVDAAASLSTDVRRHPDPFTIISSSDIHNGVWKPRSDLMIPASAVDTAVFGDTNDDVFAVANGNAIATLDVSKYCLEYCKRLETQGRFQLCIWPPHCLMGSVGHALVPCVHEALLEWSRSTGKSIEFVEKGHDKLTEMYSAIAAEVPINAATTFNTALVQSILEECDELVVAGQALSHCVQYTLRDIVQFQQQHYQQQQQHQQDNNKERAYSYRAKIVLLTDCTSCVPGFEDAAAAFLADMDRAGVQLMLSTEYNIHHRCYRNNDR